MSVGADKIIDFKEAAAEEIRYSPDAEKILAGNPEQMVQNFYTDDSNQFSAGIWSGRPGQHKVNYTEEEFCQILEGVVILHDASGNSRRFEKGDSFVIPAGFQGIWETVETARKIYVVYEK
ncbi:cupin domain-containing protein [Aestuariispira insulae]|uniref:(S)-ureidoglycine aminohydrolase cupin domain-containing protein n=1 Tax=Aestuariispira insulae TaxID=1461337 RepID=A0A3D9HJV9_9PROT|nr:cupin domain-containing protein [Aestuariispira insulae]RED49705.1 hypothetical protein DFP90_10576 [Aestuariispira insulae]